MTHNRILTTHTGSLARPAELGAMLAAISKKEAVDMAKFEATAKHAVQAAVNRQCEIGLDIINDGEQSKTGFAQYIRERLRGFEGDPVPRVLSLEARDFPSGGTGSQFAMQPCTGPVSWQDFAPVERDIANLKAATAGLKDKQVFMTAVSPGTLTNQHPNRHYKSHRDYVDAVSEVMRREYEAIAAAGFVVQLDSPDLAQRSYNFPDMSLQEWREVVAENIAAANAATKNIPREQIRVHVCWGANEGPHNHDTELHEIVDLLMTLRCGAMSIVCANGRHEHEWQVWKNVKVPQGLKIVPGVIDSTTNIIEHPKTVAERLVRFASVLGKENVIGGVDCGFGTIANWHQVDPAIAWAKLQSLVAGARLASDELWK